LEQQKVQRSSELCASRNKTLRGPNSKLEEVIGNDLGNGYTVYTATQRFTCSPRKPTCGYPAARGDLSAIEAPVSDETDALVVENIRSLFVGKAFQR